MSHFTVLIIHDADESLDDLLEPFNENRRVEPYNEEVDIQPALDWAVREQMHEADAAKNGNVTATIAILRQYEGRPIVHEDGKYYAVSTYNPDSKWDWWVIGGRWGNYFDVKDWDEAAEHILHGDQPAIGGFVPERGKADSLPKRYIDIDGMRSRAAEKAGALWDQVNEVIGLEPESLPWEHFMAKAQAGEMTWDEVRAAYGEQPRVKRFREYANANRDTFGFFSSVDEFCVSRETYIARARARAVPGFATLHNGKWTEPGSMGWWGVSSDTESSRAGYLEYINGVIDDADDDKIFTIVDCHI